MSLKHLLVDLFIFVLVDVSFLSSPSNFWFGNIFVSSFILCFIFYAWGMSQWILNRKEIDGYRNGETITIVGRRRRRFVCVLQFDSCARKMAVNKFSTLSSCNGIAYLCVIDLGHFRREVVFVTQMTADNHVWMNVQWCCCCCWCRIGTSIQYNVMWTISELCCLLIKQEVIYLSLSTRLSVISHFIRLSCVQICIAHQQCICHCCWMSSTKKNIPFRQTLHSTNSVFQ